MEEGEEKAWSKVRGEWMGWKEKGMRRRKVWEERDGGRGQDGEEEGMGRRKGWEGGRDSGRRDRDDGKKRS